MTSGPAVAGLDVALAITTATALAAPLTHTSSMLGTPLDRSSGCSTLGAMRTSMERAAVVLVALATLVAAPVLAQVVYFRMPTAAERAAPIATGGVLVQSAIGLEIPAPPGLSFSPEDPAVRAAMDAQGPVGVRTIMWSWRSADGATMLNVTANLESRRPLAERDAFVSDMLATAMGDLRAQGVTVTTSRRGPADHMAHGVHPGGVVYDVRAFAYEHGDAMVVVSVAAISVGPSSLGPVLTGARGR